MSTWRRRLRWGARSLGIGLLLSGLATSAACGTGASTSPGSDAEGSDVADHTRDLGREVADVPPDACEPPCNPAACQVCRQEDLTCVRSCTELESCVDGECEHLECYPPCDTFGCVECVQQPGLYWLCVRTCSDTEGCENGECVALPECEPACAEEDCEYCDYQAGECQSRCYECQTCDGAAACQWACGPNEWCVGGACEEAPTCEPPCSAIRCETCSPEHRLCLSACSDGEVCVDQECVPGSQR